MNWRAGLGPGAFYRAGELEARVGGDAGAVVLGGVVGGAEVDG